MIPAIIIAKKRDGHELTDGEIADLVRGYVAGRVADYQMASFAMAVCCRGMTAEETTSLTRHMLDSGVTLSWNAGPPVVDKHSTGGVGDKVSLPLAAMLACCGLRVPMISGRGLGSTGGTLDKLESIAGFRTDLSLRELQQVVADVGCVITGATDELAPADRKLYALRDVTGTVESIPLITASIMSKKLAEGLDALVLDVKWGSGAFMKTLDNARALAHSLVDTGKRMGVKTVALVTDMNQPLGRFAGNAVEVDESVAMLEGNGPRDLVELTVALGSELLVAVGVSPSRDEACNALRASIDSGRAYEQFTRMVQAQWGDLAVPRPRAEPTVVTANRSGWVQQIDTQDLGNLIIELGGGRRRKEDKIDHSVGIEMHVKLGEQVESGQPLATLLAHSPTEHFVDRVRRTILIGDSVPAAPPLIVERIV